MKMVAVKHFETCSNSSFVLLLLFAPNKQSPRIQSSFDQKHAINRILPDTTNNQHKKQIVENKNNKDCKKNNNQ